MVLHFALLDFITSCVKVITFRVVITSCVNGITSRGDYYILRKYYILRRNTRLLFITWLTKNTFSIRTPFLFLYSLFTIPKKYVLLAKRKVSYMSEKLNISVLQWTFPTFILHSMQALWNATVSCFPEWLP